MRSTTWLRTSVNIEVNHNSHYCNVWDKNNEFVVYGREFVGFYGLELECMLCGASHLCGQIQNL